MERERSPVVVIHLFPRIQLLSYTGPNKVSVGGKNFSKNLRPLDAADADGKADGEGMWGVCLSASPLSFLS